MKILVAYDGSHGADAALDDLPRAGLPDDAEILVLTVAEGAIPALTPADAPVPAALAIGQGPPALAAEADALANSRAASVAAVARVRERFPKGRVDGLVCGGSPPTAILLHADAWRPDLLVVGSRGRARPLRALLGSVARRVVTEARSCVRVARPSAAPPGTPVKVLVGHEGGVGGRAALRAAAARAWPEGSEILVVAVQSPDVVTVFANDLGWETPWPAPQPPVDRRTLKQTLEADADGVRRVGLAVTTVIRTGDAARALLSQARRSDVACVFVGATDMTRVERFVLGSVSAAVADRARCSVEVVRAPRS
jgi:nucleotide-binding universal stress UspA family protein